MIRFVISPDGLAVPDLEERLPGRGLWLTATTDIVRRACVEDSFSKAARRSVSVPADLPGRLVSLLDKRCLDMMGMARRSGAALAGFEKVCAALVSPDVALLVQASDSAGVGIEKIRRLAVGVTTLAPWTANQLGAPFGRDRVVHLVITSSRIAQSIIRDVRRRKRLLSEHTAANVLLELQES